MPPRKIILDELNRQTQHVRNTNIHSQIGNSSGLRKSNMPSNTMHNFTPPSFAQHHPHLPQHPGNPRTNAQNPPRHQAQPIIPKNAVTDILPYCTTESPLRQEQVIALSDVVGSVKELVLLAVGAAAGDGACVDKLEGAVGAQKTGCIVEFFAGEWEVE